MKGFLLNKGDPMKKTLIVLLIIFIFIFVASLVLISLSIKSRNDDIATFEQLSQLAKAPTLPSVDRDGEEQIRSDAPTSHIPSEVIPSDQQTETKNIEPLNELNEDCVGWITVQGTVIDYPVMYTPDEPNKYFRRNFYGQYSVSGVPYIFETCTEDCTNLIIFGHNMLNGTMFAGLMSYRDKEFFDTHRRIEYKSQGESVEYEIFCVAVVDDTDRWYAFTHGQDQAQFDEMVADIKSRALHFSDPSPAFGDRLITLSTCYNRTGPKRLVVIACGS